jgi:hypothetical protein
MVGERVKFNAYEYRREQARKKISVCRENLEEQAKFYRELKKPYEYETLECREIMKEMYRKDPEAFEFGLMDHNVIPSALIEVMKELHCSSLESFMEELRIYCGPLITIEWEETIKGLYHEGFGTFVLNVKKYNEDAPVRVVTTIDLLKKDMHTSKVAAYHAGIVPSDPDQYSFFSYIKDHVQTLRSECSQVEQDIISAEAELKEKLLAYLKTDESDVVYDETTSIEDLLALLTEAPSEPTAEISSAMLKITELRSMSRILCDITETFCREIKPRCVNRDWFNKWVSYFEVNCSEPCFSVICDMGRGILSKIGSYLRVRPHSVIPEKTK